MHLEDYGKYTEIQYIEYVKDPDLPYHNTGKFKAKKLTLKGFRYKIGLLSEFKSKRVKKYLSKELGIDANEIKKIVYIKNGERDVYPLGIVLAKGSIVVPIVLTFSMAMLIFSPILVPYILIDENYPDIKRFIKRVRL